MDKNEKDIQRTAKKYNKTNRILSATETVIFFFILILIFVTGLSKEIEDFSFGITSNKYIALIIFLGVIGLAESIIAFPFNFYSGFILEHKYNLSNQTLLKYFIEKLKAFLVSLVIGIPVIMIFYYILFNFENNWWLILGLFLFFYSVIIGKIAPVLIFPIFYKFKPFNNDSVKNRILSYCRKENVKINDIFVFDMSKNTKKANAAFTGIGKTKRIILGDTLLEKFSEDEIESVFAHEVGHYKKFHIHKLLFISTVLTFTGLYLTSLFYNLSLGLFGFNHIYDISALPLMAVFLSLYGLITSPLSNIFSRKFEREADNFALDTTGNSDAFISAMEKLAEQNLADKMPNRIIEFLFHSHPSIQKRIDFAKNYMKM